VYSPPSDHSTDHSDVREVVTFLRRHAVVVVLTAAITGAVGFGVSFTQPKTYLAKTSLLYSASAGAQTQDPTRAIDTILGIAGSNDVLFPVARRHGLTMPALKARMSILGDANADIISIVARARVPATATSLANDVARSLISWRQVQRDRLLQAQINSLKKQLQALAGNVAPSAVAAASDLRAQISQAQAQLDVAAPDLTVITPAIIPSSPATPHPERIGAVSALVGVIVGILIGLFRDRLDHRIRRIEDAEAIYRAPLLGAVPFARRRNRIDLLADFGTASPEAAAFRTIRTSLALLGPPKDHGLVVVVSSAIPAEGKSATVANLACAFAAAGKRVLAASADLHDPALHEYFAGTITTQGVSPVAQRIATGFSAEAGGFDRGTQKPAGLIEVLSGEIGLEEAVRRVPLPLGRGSVGLLSSTRTLFDPAALFGPDQMNRFLLPARDSFDVIVLDTPPLLASAEAALLAQHGDAFVLVTRLNHLTRNQARRAIQVLTAAHVTPTGLVVTGDLDTDVFEYGYAYGSGETSRSPRVASAQRM
jgi:receptor protein-tyrosine kinase